MWDRRLTGLKSSLESREGHERQEQDRQRQQQEEVVTTASGLARRLGWGSIGVGLAVVAAPGPVMKATGMGDRPKLGRLLGVRDLVLGTGMPRGHNTALWCRARGTADALNVALLIGGAATGAFRRDRAAISTISAAGFSALSFWLARRLDQ
jgi:hypothetical protein